MNRLVHYTFAFSLFSVVDTVHATLSRIEQLIKETKDILECRVEATLEEIGLTALCNLPEEDAISAEDFLKSTEQVCKQSSTQLSK